MLAHVMLCVGVYLIFHSSVCSHKGFYTQALCTLLSIKYWTLDLHWISHNGAPLSFCHWKGLKVFHQLIRYWKNWYSLSNKSSNEKLSYPAVIVSSRCSDADWSRQSGEGFLTRQHADPHLLRTEQEVQCTQDDLGRGNRNHHNDKKCSWKVLL